MIYIHKPNDQTFSDFDLMRQESAISRHSVMKQSRYCGHYAHQYYKTAYSFNDTHCTFYYFPLFFGKFIKPNLDLNENEEGQKIFANFETNCDGTGTVFSLFHLAWQEKQDQMNRAFQSVVFNSGQKMALRVFYFTRALTKALTYYYINRSQRHLLAAIENN